MSPTFVLCGASLASTGSSTAPDPAALIADLAMRSSAKGSSASGTFHLLVLRYSGVLQAYRLNAAPR